MRLTWVQPEDLLAHELVASASEGRAVEGVSRRWLDAGGDAEPPVGGAAAEAASSTLRALAVDLLDELARLPVDPQLAAREPDDLAAIEATWLPVLELPVLELPVRAIPEVSPYGRGGREGGREAGREGGRIGEVWQGAGAGGPLADRIHGGWLGRACGCLLGKPVEKVPREGIREILQATGRWPLRGYFTAVGLPDAVAARWPWNRRSATTSLVENIRGMPEDDDLNFAMLALRILEEHGPGFTTEDVARAWLSDLPAGRVFTAERVAYRNLLEGVSPPRTATVRNPFRDWIGAAIRTDVHGWAHPGRPREAARLAWRDARLSHTRNGVYGAMFVAAACSAAVVAGDVGTVIQAGLSVVPPDSRYAAAVRRGVEVARAEPDLERALDVLHAEFGQFHWVHALNNAALVAFSLTHGDGELTRATAAAVTGGWDTDSDGATVGSICGALAGAAALPDAWTAPLRNRVASTLPGFDGISIDELARRTLDVVGVMDAAVGQNREAGRWVG